MAAILTATLHTSFGSKPVETKIWDGPYPDEKDAMGWLFGSLCKEKPLAVLTCTGAPGGDWQDIWGWSSKDSDEVNARPVSFMIAD